MKRKPFGGNRPPMITANVHLDTFTALSIDVVVDETPLLTIGEEVTLFFMDRSVLRRTIEALQDLERGSSRIGMTWATYVDASAAYAQCPVHGDTCRPVWHKGSPVG